MTRPMIGISACLLGQPVRFNGGHKKDNWVTDTLASVADFTAYCPEVGIGLPTPRPTLRLIAKDSEIRAVDSDTQSKDYTAPLQAYFDQHSAAIGQLDGYILMQGSPSCGMERVKLYGDRAMPEKIASGVFAERLQQAFPNMPIEEAGRLNDAPIAESFLTRLYVYHEWRTTQPYQSAASLIRFHSKHKFLIMLHDYAGYRRAGRMLADLSNSSDLPIIAEQYLTEIMNSLKAISTTGQRTNALLHLFGFLRTYLEPSEKDSVLAVIKRYQQQDLPYVVPLTMLRHYATVHQQKDGYMWQQSVWAPYPEHLNQYKNIV